MAVTVTVAEAAIAIRAATDAGEIPQAVSTALAIMFPAAKALVEEYAPSAPGDVQNAALVRLLGWLYDAEPSDPQVGRAMQVSGAGPLLARWRVHRAGAIGGGDETPAVPSGSIPTPPAEGHFMLRSNNGVLSWVAFPPP